MMRRAVPCAWLVATAMLLSMPCSADSWGLAPGEWYSELRGGSFTADSWHNEDGDRQSLFGGGTVEDRTLLAYNEFGWHPHLAFIIGVPAKSLTRRGTSLPVLRTESGLGDALIGFKWNFANGATAIAVQADWKAPLGYNRHVLATHQDSVISGDASGNGDSLDVARLRQASPPRLGDGQQDLGISLLIGKQLPGLRGYVEASGGYRHRFDDPADQVVGGAELGFWLTPALLLAGRYEGEAAMGEGSRVQDEVDHHRVGPRIVFRVDDTLDLIAGSLHTAAARNAFHTDEIYVGMAFKQSSLSRFQGAFGTRRSP